MLFRGMRTDLMVAAGLLTILAVMVMPLPPMMLDLLLALNISLSLTILLASIYVERPVEFNSFPSLLLITTLFRLSMNVASTRLILLNGSSGVDAAGHIIRSFGQFVVGGSYLVGIIIFVILIIINFLVITKGSGRIAEVAARFTLDAMPGKQMAIDADLNAGLINEMAARKRREGIESEANFYGAMDGASKFVRGDAIAGILITGINIVAGFVIGVTQEGMTAADAAQTYTILTVGDGLVSQIPSLVISAAAGIIVTRAATTATFGSTVVTQLAGSRKTYIVLCAALACFGLVPGMPLLLFAPLSIGAGVVAWFFPQIAGHFAAPEEDDPLVAEEEETPGEEQQIKALLPLSDLQLTIGYALVPLVDEDSGGDLLDRIGGIRKTFATELGFIMPAVHISDDLTLPPNDYRVLLKGEEIGRGELYPDQMLAIDPGIVSTVVDGMPTREPAFGLDALWIRANSRDEAELGGYTVVEPSAVVATHLSELVRQHAGELVGRQEVQELLDIVAETNPKLVEELVPQHLGLGEIVQVLRQLLTEQISIRDIRSILETLADHAPKSRDVDVLTEFVRERLSRVITRQYADGGGTLHVLTLDHQAEAVFRRGQLADGTPAMDPRVAQSLLSNIEARVSAASEMDVVPVLLTPPDLRRKLRTFTERFIPNLPVLSYKEVDPGADIRAVGAVTV